MTTQSRSRVVAGSLVPVALVLLAAGCSAPVEVEPTEEQPAESVEAVREAVIEAHRSLVRAYETGDVEAFLAVLDGTPDLLIFHPLVQNRFDGPDRIRQNLPVMFGRLGGDCTWSDVHPMVRVEGDVAWLTSHVMIEAAGRDMPFLGRGTEIWTRKDGRWRLSHAHWSENPEVGATGG